MQGGPVSLVGLSIELLVVTQAIASFVSV